MIQVRRSLVFRPIPLRSASSGGLLVTLLTALMGLIVIVGCGGGTSARSSSSSAVQSSEVQPAGDWPTYQHDAARSGVSADQAALGDVRQVWTSVEFDAPLYVFALR
jgi:hypothetical protein